MKNTEVKHRRLRVLAAVLVGYLMCFAAAGAYGAPLANGDFETGDLSGWELFTSANGTLGGAGFPMVFDFDIRGDGVATKCAGFKIGQRRVHSHGLQPEGGGIYQTVHLGAGRLTIAAEIATSYSSQRHMRNGSGGFFELLLDNKVLDSHDFGAIVAGATERSTLSGLTSIPAGMHEIRVRITRRGVVKVGTPTPFQFVDNVTVTRTPTR